MRRAENNKYLLFPIYQGINASILGFIIPNNAFLNLTRDAIVNALKLLTWCE
jgi:hypothetical protein